jgi:GT2 family glycosyltransferase
MEAAIILVGQRRLQASIDSLDVDSRIGWTAFSLPVGEAFSRFDGESALKYLDVEAPSSDFVVFCLSGTVFKPDALVRLAEALESKPDCSCVYGDVEIQGQGGSVWPMAFSAFDFERVLEQGYGALFFAMPFAKAIEALGTAGSLFELFNSNIAAERRAGVWHLPGPLATVPAINVESAAAELCEATRAHLTAARVEASVEVRSKLPFPAVRVRRSAHRDERTTVIIPTRNRVGGVRKCIESIIPGVEKAGANILIVNNGSNDPETIESLAAPSQCFDVLSIEGPFNVSRLSNVAVQHCETDNICLLSDDIEAIDASWLLEMLSRLSDPEIGAVGAKLVWPSGVVRHGGLLLGVNFGAARAFDDRMDGDPGYAGLLEVAHECSAVSAACLLMRRADFLAAEGMDEIRFPLNFNDVDLCLKLRERGSRIVFTPDAKLLHLPPASHGRDEAPDLAASFGRELLMLRAKWGEALTHDPYYSPLLGLDVTPFSSLALPPRSWNARRNEPPRSSTLPAGF